MKSSKVEPSLIKISKDGRMGQVPISMRPCVQTPVPSSSPSTTKNQNKTKEKTKKNKQINMSIEYFQKPQRGQAKTN
jgi:hypothetical protein